MDEFEIFDNIESKPEDNYNSYNKNKNNNWNKKGKFVKREKIKNVIGSITIDLWNDNKPVEQQELDYNEFNNDKKFVTFILPDKMTTLTDEEMEKFTTVMKLLHKNNYRVRVICNGVKSIFKQMMNIFGEDDVKLITPWKGYCKDDKDHIQYLITDDTIKVAAYYFKGYDRLPAGIKYKKAALIGTLFGLKVDAQVSMVVTLDNNYDGKKIDFSKSPDTGDYFLAVRTFSLTLYNLAIKEDYDNLVYLLKPKDKET